MKKQIYFVTQRAADFTRIVASDPIMWRDIAIANKDAGYNG